MATVFNDIWESFVGIYDRRCVCMVVADGKGTTVTVCALFLSAYLCACWCLSKCVIQHVIWVGLLDAGYDECG